MRHAISSTIAAAAFCITAALGGPAGADMPARISLDYAYYNPVSLLIKEKGWLEEAFAEDGVEIQWVLSLGSNRALEYLNSRSIDFGSTAGAAALLGKANGNPIKTVYVYSQPEWTALVTRPDTGITQVEDLKGKRVAVTRGTDPHIFLLQALNRSGLGERDIRVVLLQHPDGQRALETGQVDAWAGLDPHMAQSELENGSVLFYRDASANTYGVLNVREAFAEAHPEAVDRVIAVYERGRHHALENPDELRDVLVAYAKTSPEVAQKQLSERTRLDDPVPGARHRETLVTAGTALRSIDALPGDTDVEALVDALLDPGYVRRVVQVQESRQ